MIKSSGRQIARQVLIGLIVLAIWGGALGLFVSVTTSPQVTVASSAAPATISTVLPSPTIAVPSATATSQATATASATSTRLAATATQPSSTATKPAATATAAATSTPTVLPSATSVSTEAAAAPTSAASVAVSFARDVQPIFNRICVKCHGGEEINEGLVLKTYADIMAGSDNGPVIVPGDPANSLLIDLITRGKMPKQGPRLLPAEIRTITDWVTAGAANN